MAATTILSLIASPVVSIAVDKLNTLATTEFLAFFHVKDDVEKLKSTFEDIQRLLEVVEPNKMNYSQPGNLDFWSAWLQKLRAAAYDAEDLISTWTTEYNQWEVKKQVHNLCLPFCPCNFLCLHRGLKKLKEITSTLEKILTQGGEYKPFIPEISKGSSRTPEIGSLTNKLGITRKDGEKKVKGLLLTDEKSSVGKNFSLIPIVGMGGLGKTTLAQVVFNDTKVVKLFNFRIWVHVTRNFDMKTILRNILLSVLQHTDTSVEVSSLTLQQLQTCILDKLHDKRFLLVLDDLWNYKDDELEDLVNILNNVRLLEGKENKVLVTSRLIEVSKIHGATDPYKLQQLTHTESWSLFEKFAFKKDKERNPLQVSWGKEIVRNCKGLPLAVKQMGSLLRGEPVSKWKKIKESSKTWKLQDDTKVLDALKLSYDNLPSAYHKQCFAFCALFPKGYVYERDELIKLWMAEEFIQPAEGERTEDIGRSYFKVLSDRFFFERSTKGKDESTEKEDEGESAQDTHEDESAHDTDEDESAHDTDEDEPAQDEVVEESATDEGEDESGRGADENEDESPQDKDEIRYAMHDLIHDLAISISSPFSCQVKDMKDFNEQCRHASLLPKDDQQPTLETIIRSKKVRTLLFPVQHFKAFGKAQREIFHSLLYMRVLDLSSSTLLTQLPDSIGRLTLLHYLDLSRTEIKELPDSICNLCNLETLKLLGCPWLFVLPMNLKNLIKLRHLELDEFFWNKASTFPPNMGCLTSLHNLHKFQVGIETGYRLEELKNMAYLTGTLHISKLENAVDAGEANLKQKARIRKVVYEWSSRDPTLQDEATEIQVLEDLQPHQNVEDLQFRHYGGTEIPSWMQGDGRVQLQRLVKIYLNRCTGIKILSLGKLPDLTELRLKNMPELEEWPEECYRSLRRLQICDCPKLTNFPLIFPSLYYLKIKRCESLDTIPSGPIMFIILVDNPVLKHWTGENIFSPILTGENIFGPILTGESIFCPILTKDMLNVTIINCPELHRLPSQLYPQELKISGCRSLSAIPDKHHAKRLQLLALDGCNASSIVGRIPSTRPQWFFLTISNISNLVCLSEWPSFPSLQALYIWDCKDLVHLSNGENMLFLGFVTLTTLSIRNCPKLVTLPVEGLPTSLQYLSIVSCEMLKSFGPPNVLKKLTSLTDLYIEDCPALQYLPEDGLPTTLLHLSIQKCPSLIEQCRKEDGDFLKIKDILDLEIETPSIRTPTSSSSAAWYHLPLSCGEFLVLFADAIKRIAGWVN